MLPRSEPCFGLSPVRDDLLHVTRPSRSGFYPLEQCPAAQLDRLHESCVPARHDPANGTLVGDVAGDIPVSGSSGKRDGSERRRHFRRGGHAKHVLPAIDIARKMKTSIARICEAVIPHANLQLILREGVTPTLRESLHTEFEATSTASLGGRQSALGTVKAMCVVVADVTTAGSPSTVTWLTEADGENPVP